MALRIQTVMTLVKTTAGTYGPYTGPSTPSVSGGRIAIPMDGTVQQVGSVILDGTPSDADGGPSFHQWFCWPQSSQEDPGIADGAEFRISNHGSDADSLELWGIRHPSGYEVRARKVDGTLVGTGTTRFSWTDANRYDLRICRTANGARLRIEYGDSLEIDVATAVGSLWPFAKLGTASNHDGTKFMRGGAAWLCNSTSGAAGNEDSDRPYMTLPSVALDPATGTPQFNEYTGVTPAGDKWLTVDDMAAPDEDTSFNASTNTASDTDEQSYQTADATIPGNFIAVLELVRWRMPIAAKTLEPYLGIYDGTNVRRTAPSLDGVNYITQRYVWNVGPDNGAWDQTRADSLQVGTRAIKGVDVVALRVTAIGAEMLGLQGGDALSPAPTVADRRRLLVSVI